ncbi:Radical SAM domain protein [Desulfovibrio sp. X2]|nr:Radical SAM domain protein [Desulfovibrio sp. X2]
MPLTIRSLASGGIITTYRCGSRCAHCLYDCGPHRRHAFIEPDEAARAARTARSLGCSSLHVGGGEPFLNPENLREVLRALRGEGVRLEYVETGACWAGREDAAADLLAELRAAGLHSLLVSISPFHNEHVDFSRTRAVLSACERSGVRALPWGAQFYGEIEALGEGRHSLAEYGARYGADYLRAVPERFWVHMGGRALATYRPYMEHRPADEAAAASGPCTALADVSHFHFDLWGNYVPGLCAGLALRREDVGRPLERERYPLLWLLWDEGVRGLLRAARERGFAPEAEGYVSACDLCTACRRFLYAAGDFRELAPSGFYRSQGQGPGPSSGPLQSQAPYPLDSACEVQ